jgi:hypothetical protein
VIPPCPPNLKVAKQPTGKTIKCLARACARVYSRFFSLAGAECNRPAQICGVFAPTLAAARLSPPTIGSSETIAGWYCVPVCWSGQIGGLLCTAVEVAEMCNIRTARSAESATSWLGTLPATVVLDHWAHGVWCPAKLSIGSCWWDPNSGCLITSRRCTRVARW